MKAAIIDLGTNTCNLLIANIEGANYQILCQEKALVGLGDNRIQKNEISPEATKRTLSAFSKFKERTKEYQVHKTTVLATSAVRTAKNKIQFLESVGDQSGWAVKVISGEHEAELIFKGVLLAIGKSDSAGLILDIGGGSNETIIFRGKRMLWKESRATGMARIINQFPVSDPITGKEITEIRNYFKSEHDGAIRESKNNQANYLIGCSGAFDTIADIIDQTDPGTRSRIYNPISLEAFRQVYSLLIHSTRTARLKMKGMDYVRVDLIVPAMILIDTLITGGALKHIIHTDFALREGVLSDLIPQPTLES